VLSDDDALRLLLRQARRDRTTPDITQAVENEAKEIVKELGYLPLAIEQAAGYIRESLYGLTGFLSIYRSNRAHILRRVGPPSYQESVWTSWNMSFIKLRELSPGSLELLNLFAFLNPDGISIEFLQAGKEALEPHTRDLLDDRYRFDQLYTALCRFSLVRLIEKSNSIAVHRLVQAVVKGSMSVEEQTLWRGRALTLCKGAFPWVREKDITLQRHFRSQVVSCITDVEMENSDMAADMLSRLAWYFDCETQYEDSVPLWERAITMYRNLHGVEEAQLFICMDWLGESYVHLGRLARAAELRHVAFPSLRRILGNEHEDTVASQRNLGVTLVKQGQISEGILLIEDACAVQRKMWGDANPRTQSTMRKLASTYVQQGRTKDAEELLEAVYLNTKSHRRGTFRAVQCDLGWVYCLQGKVDEGITLLENSYKLQKDSLGEEHPVTLVVARYLSCAYIRQGRFTEGMERLKKTIEMQKKALGVKHQDTLLSIKYLAEAYRKHGREEESSALFEELTKRGWSGANFLDYTT
jgi:tetratricopeptide (TPR) repeat protein